jgi:hypothetical protein
MPLLWTALLTALINKGHKRIPYFLSLQKYFFCDKIDSNSYNCVSQVCSVFSAKYQHIDGDKKEPHTQDWNKKFVEEWQSYG